MKRIFIGIAILVLVLIILFSLSILSIDKIKSTYYLYKYFSKYDRQQFDDADGEGIYFNITKTEETVQTILGTSYWTENDKIKLLLLVQTLPCRRIKTLYIALKPGKKCSFRFI